MGFLEKKSLIFFIPDTLTFFNARTPVDSPSRFFLSSSSCFRFFSARSSALSSSSSPLFRLKSPMDLEASASAFNAARDDMCSSRGLKSMGESLVSSRDLNRSLKPSETYEVRMKSSRIRCFCSCTICGEVVSGTTVLIDEAVETSENTAEGAVLAAEDCESTTSRSSSSFPSSSGATGLEFDYRNSGLFPSDA
jgi:hypothetical protein